MAISIDASGVSIIVDKPVFSRVRHARNEQPDLFTVVRTMRIYAGPEGAAVSRHGCKLRFPECTGLFGRSLTPRRDTPNIAVNQRSARTRRAYRVYDS
jgi:hypothetical protein